MTVAAPAEAFVPTRVFLMQAVELDDLDPSATPEEIKDLWTPSYPFLAGATVEGPSVDGDRLVYRFVDAAPNTKG